MGSAVTRYRVGDQIMGSVGPTLGAHAEYVRVSEDGVIARKPANLSWTDAVAIFDGGLTALPFLRDSARLTSGQSILINGASGAVGTAAVQLAKHLGAAVTAVTSSANFELVKSLGADEAIDYTVEDFTKSGRLYDVVFDAVGKSSYTRSRKLLKPGGDLPHHRPVAADPAPDAVDLEDRQDESGHRVHRAAQGASHGRRRGVPGRADDRRKVRARHRQAVHPGAGFVCARPCGNRTEKRQCRHLHGRCNMSREESGWRLPQLDRQSLGIVDASERAIVRCVPLGPALDGDARRLQLRGQRIQLRDTEVEHEGLVRRKIIGIGGKGGEHGHPRLLLPDAVLTGLDAEMLAIPCRPRIRIAAAEEEPADSRYPHGVPPCILTTISNCAPLRPLAGGQPSTAEIGQNRPEAILRCSLYASVPPRPASACSPSPSSRPSTPPRARSSMAPKCERRSCPPRSITSVDGVPCN